jgi:hypothetical protein
MEYSLALNLENPYLIRIYCEQSVEMMMMTEYVHNYTSTYARK